MTKPFLQADGHSAACSERACAITTAQAENDLRLTKRLLAGCEQAWAEFVSMYAALVRARVARTATTCGMDSDRVLIDDLVAEVFSALLHNDSAALRAYAGRSSLATYLCVIASRVAIRKSLKAARSKTAQSNGDEGAAEVVDSRHPPPPQAAINAEQREHLHRLIAELPDRQQAIVKLFYMDGRSYEHISKQLQIPIGSIGPTLKRAEAKLKERIGTF